MSSHSNPPLSLAANNSSLELILLLVVDVESQKYPKIRTIGAYKHIVSQAAHSLRAEVGWLARLKRIQRFRIDSHADGSGFHSAYARRGVVLNSNVRMR